VSSMIRIAVATTKSGKQGFALRTFNQHSNSWQFIGEIHTGPNRWAKAAKSRAELMAELNDMAGSAAR
jgi:hypothetical protein